MGLFSDKEQKEILANKDPRLKNDPALAAYLYTFYHTTSHTLRRRMQKNDSEDIGDGEEHSRARMLSTRRWIYRTVLSMTELMDGKAENRYGQVQSERWFELHVWKMIDDCILSQLDIKLERDEPARSASAYRKNGNATRVVGGRGKMRKKNQWPHDNIEVGGIELGSQEEDSTGVKVLNDSLKLEKLLKDQFDFADAHIPGTKDKLEMLSLQLLDSLEAASILINLPDLSRTPPLEPKNPPTATTSQLK
ncbi:hypothetical protein BG011_007838 [Mortierella polycephala]|uniref:Uncharacterized protein n=1 Tax=Mortierella polycephala TaxID=41804 RepID=A0A9P6U7G7_9FUNG|nr:hypothetical protein BG011_007838 [Mortierella polycephala]